MKLPWTYWPIMAVALILNMAFGAMLGAAIGVNPYIAAGVVGSAMVLYEVWTLARDAAASTSPEPTTPTGYGPSTPDAPTTIASSRTGQTPGGHRKEPSQ